jgi:hypothetical protein
MLQNTTLILLLSVFVLPFKTNPPVICQLGDSASTYNDYEDQRPTADTMQLAQRVSAALKSACWPNCPSLVIFRNPTAPNAILLFDSGLAKMAYSPQFFNDVYAKYGDGAIIAIIAHMLGHALNETTPAGWMKNDWTPELRADAWAGCALANAGLSTRGLRDALTAVSVYPSASHPGWSQRLQAVRLGYIHCGGDGSKLDSQAGTVKRK